MRVGVVIGSGGTDPSAGSLARAGLRRAERLLGVDGTVVYAHSPAAFTAALTKAAGGDDLVVAVGIPSRKAFDRVAKRFQEVDFAAIGLSQAGLPSKPSNVRGVLFKEEEAGYLVGYLAGLMNAEEAGSRQTIGSVGAWTSKAAERYVAGFEAGAQKANSKITTLHDGAGTSLDPARCKELALSQIAKGSDIVFEVAGRCRLGALTAAAEQNVWGIGIDADRGDLSQHILTSAVRRIDVAIFETIADAQDKHFSGGEDVVFDVASGGVGIGRISPEVPPDIVVRVQALQDDLAAGKITGIPDRLR